MHYDGRPWDSVGRLRRGSTEISVLGILLALGVASGYSTRQNY